MYSLTPAERQAVTSLKKNSNIVVKPADKGGATVIMNKADYITEADRQLSNAAFYSPLTRDPTPAYRRELKSLLCTLPVDVQRQINDMTPQDPRPGTFYLLPKIHKVGNPGRPIISGIGTITEGVSGFVDSILRPYATSAPSYIKDTSVVVLESGLGLKSSFMWTWTWTWTWTCM